MRTIILCESLALVFVVLSYILKCLEYKDLRELFDNRGKSIKMLNDEVESLKYQWECQKISSKSYHENMNFYRNMYYHRRADWLELQEENKRKDRAIKRYKAQNEAFRHCYHAVEARNTKLENKLLTEESVSNYYKFWYKAMQTERDAYLYCLRQIQEEVENAKKE